MLSIIRKVFKKTSVKHINHLTSIGRMETITIPKEEYENLKKRANIDEELLADLIEGIEDIKAGRVRRVK